MPGAGNGSGPRQGTLIAVLSACVCVLAASTILLGGRISSERAAHGEMAREMALASARMDTLAGISGELDARTDSLARMSFLVDSLRARLVERDLSGGYQGYYLLIDTYQNRFHMRLRTAAGEDLLVRSGYCGTGKGWTANDLGQAWDFSTPRGVRYVLGNGQNPYWYRPDWYWEEMNLTPPDPGEVVVIPDTLSWTEQIAYYNDSLTSRERVWVRAVPGVLGNYKIDLGGGVLIHYGVGRGSNVSHGCIRVSTPDLEALYRTLPVGAPVVIY